MDWADWEARACGRVPISGERRFRVERGTREELRRRKSNEERRKKPKTEETKDGRNQRRKKPETEETEDGRNQRRKKPETEETKDGRNQRRKKPKTEETKDGRRAKPPHSVARFSGLFVLSLPLPFFLILGVFLLQFMSSRKSSRREPADVAAGLDFAAEPDAPSGVRMVWGINSSTFTSHCI